MIWGGWNRGHIKKHDVSEDEVEELCKGTYKQQPTYDNRFLIFGRVGKRLLTVILARESAGKYYVITARDMSKKERKDFIK